MTTEYEKICAVSDASELEELTHEANFLCERCGAKAHRETNVCVPVMIEPDH
jgi:hypothetical protein